MDWEWQRKLAEVAPARLIVTPLTWRIEAYLPGVDARHSGKIWRVPAEEVEQYARTLVEAWKRLIELDATAPTDVSVSADGGKGIRIILRGYPGRGVTLQDTHGLICSEAQLTSTLSELAGLAAEAAAVQSLLLPLSNPRSDTANGKLQVPSR
jgi:hypothetical protein